MTKLQVSPSPERKSSALSVNQQMLIIKRNWTLLRKLILVKLEGRLSLFLPSTSFPKGGMLTMYIKLFPCRKGSLPSKLLISQVLGRGLRLPRMVPIGQIHGNYPIVTITNHERFADHIKDLVDAVTECESRFTSKVLQVANGLDRAKYNFTVFNLEYLPGRNLRTPKKQRRTCQIERLY